MTTLHNKTEPIVEDFFYDNKEEKLNILTHLIGFGLALIGLVFLVVKGVGYDFTAVIVFGIYGLSQVIIFGSSTLYHSTQNVQKRRRFRIIDHSAIYVCIAGTYTPICLYAMQPDVGKNLLLLVWSFATLGLVFKLFFTGRFELISMLLYVVMGCLILFYKNNLLLSGADLNLLIGGGLVYILGAVLYSIDKLRFNHALFHICVLIGSALHFCVIYFYVSP